MHLPTHTNTWRLIIFKVDFVVTETASSCWSTARGCEFCWWDLHWILWFPLSSLPLGVTGTACSHPARAFTAIYRACKGPDMATGAAEWRSFTLKWLREQVRSAPYGMNGTEGTLSTLTLSSSTSLCPSTPRSHTNRSSLAHSLPLFPFIQIRNTEKPQPVVPL